MIGSADHAQSYSWLQPGGDLGDELEEMNSCASHAERSVQSPAGSDFELPINQAVPRTKESVCSRPLQLALTEELRRYSIRELPTGCRGE
jgi:hypothetical protein